MKLVELVRDERWFHRKEDTTAAAAWWKRRWSGGGNHCQLEEGRKEIRCGAYASERWVTLGDPLTYGTHEPHMCHVSKTA